MKTTIGQWRQGGDAPAGHWSASPREMDGTDSWNPWFAPVPEEDYVATWWIPGTEDDPPEKPERPEQESTEAKAPTEPGYYWAQMMRRGHGGGPEVVEAVFDRHGASAFRAGMEMECGLDELRWGPRVNPNDAERLAEALERIAELELALNDEKRQHAINVDRAARGEGQSTEAKEVLAAENKRLRAALKAIEDVAIDWAEIGENATTMGWEIAGMVRGALVGVEDE